MVKSCCVKLCNSEAYPGCENSFFSFPKNEKLRQQWIEVVPFKNKYSTCSYICSLHFKFEDVTAHKVKSILKPNSIPSIFPGVQLQGKPVESIVNVVKEENLEPTPSTSMDPLKAQTPEKPIKSIVHGSKEEKESTPSTSKKPLRKRRAEDFENVISRNKKLQYKLKLLTRQLKRRDDKIDNLKSVLNFILKKSSKLDELENVLIVV
ncbi:hypothetical protein PYW07_004167 [Mythimna separata]|uniref:THAP-type domain-containing protein n=1 Tax=Mythimna separata TaxID=271217 RepID=A0AAD7YQZ4_MYTSE|nr:hypothetical protein PYW07_004167 [Mythimna separata]